MYRPLRLTGYDQLKQKIELLKLEEKIPQKLLDRIGADELINEGTYGSIYTIKDNDQIVAKINKRPVATCDDLYEVRMHRKMENASAIFHIPKLTGVPVVYQQRCVLWMEKIIPPNGFDSLIELVPGRRYSLSSSIGNWHQFGLEDILNYLPILLSIKSTIYAFNLGAWLADAHFNHKILPIDVEIFIARICNNHSQNEFVDYEDSSEDVSTHIISVPPCQRSGDTSYEAKTASPEKIIKFHIPSKEYQRLKAPHPIHYQQTQCSNNQIVVVDFDKVREMSDFTLSTRLIIQNLRELMFPPPSQTIESIFQVENTKLLEKMKRFSQTFENGYRTVAVEILEDEEFVDKILSAR